LLISHISDIHLGYSQFNLQEREEDIYEIFEEAIDKSIEEHAEIIILAGDIFHTPRPSGASIIKLANQLKKLKEMAIPVENTILTECRMFLFHTSFIISDWLPD